MAPDTSTPPIPCLANLATDPNGNCATTFVLASQWPFPLANSGEDYDTSFTNQLAFALLLGGFDSLAKA